jgi:hypothetical protein
MSNETLISKHAADLWWGDGWNTGTPPPPTAVAHAPLPPWSDPHAGLAMVLALLALIFTPFGIAAWITANHELRRIEAGACSKRGAGFIVFAKIVGVSVTLLALTVFVGLIAFSVSR